MSRTQSNTVIGAKKTHVGSIDYPTHVRNYSVFDGLGLAIVIGVVW